VRPAGLRAAAAGLEAQSRREPSRSPCAARSSKRARVAQRLRRGAGVRSRRRDATARSPRQAIGDRARHREGGHVARPRGACSWPSRRRASSAAFTHAGVSPTRGPRVGAVRGRADQIAWAGLPAQDERTVGSSGAGSAGSGQRPGGSARGACRPLADGREPHTRAWVDSTRT
jgi:hypothetical protein